MHGLKVTADTNLFQTDFLDATFDLNFEKFWPYRKSNDSPLYINTRSNHPPFITKQLPRVTIYYRKRLSLGDFNCYHFLWDSKSTSNLRVKETFDWFFFLTSSPSLTGHTYSYPSLLLHTTGCPKKKFIF